MISFPPLPIIPTSLVVPRHKKSKFRRLAHFRSRGFWVFYFIFYDNHNSIRLTLPPVCLCTCRIVLFFHSRLSFISHSPTQLALALALARSQCRPKQSPLQMSGRSFSRLCLVSTSDSTAANSTSTDRCRYHLERSMEMRRSILGKPGTWVGEDVRGGLSGSCLTAEEARESEVSLLRNMQGWQCQKVT